MLKLLVNEELKTYIKNNIFPQYDKNDSAHKIDHIHYVISRCFELCKDKTIDFNMLYVIAAYHDIGYHMDSKNHEIVSARIMYEDKNLRKFFDEEQLEIMKEAIEDHRASLGKEPRNIYGKLVSSADRNVSVDESLRRIYYYSVEHCNKSNEEETIEECYQHTLKKYGENGYTNFFLEDKKYDDYLKKLRYLLNNKSEFIIRFKKIISEIK